MASLGEAESGPDLAVATGGRLAANILHFARVLRRAGLAVGPGQVLTAIRAVAALPNLARDDLYWCLHACLITRHADKVVFDQAFHVFWRNPQLLERMMAAVLPQLRIEAEPGAPMARRLADAFRGDGPPPVVPADGDPGERIEIDAALTWSDRERLQAMDFESMSAAELAEAKAAMASFATGLKPLRTRRWRPDAHGVRVDMGASLRAALRGGSGNIPLRRKARVKRQPPLVVLCDISGSMSRYSRMFLHFMHALAGSGGRVHSFLFGTRLSNVTHALRDRDPDVALARIGREVEDWSGGTRLGAALARFNRLWSRRVLAQGAVVLLVTDGLDREPGPQLGHEMERLAHSCRRLIWLNPLLRYDAWAPKAAGPKAMLPHVDEFRPAHNLNSLAELAAALAGPAGARGGAARDWAARG